jgi:non-specific serine/threonine protein kinase
MAKQLLLLLDNCEHLIAACAHLAATLLRSCQNIRILATSRERLGIAGELTYRVPSLTMPDLEHMVTPQTVNLYESVRLFVERALFHKPEFAITNHNAPALAQLCHRLDGIPLAIELAAARVRSLSVEDINGRLDSRFRLLTGGDRSALPRQQTLRALVDWSYDLLTEQEKVLLARLSVFAGGWTLEAAEAVCGLDPIEDWEVLDVLTGLLDKSLALVEEEKGDTRYRMLETIRQYGTEKLESVGAVAQVRDRHRDYFLALAEEAEPLLEGPDQAKWLTRLKTEYDNLRAALAWCIEASQSADGAAIEAGLRLSGALSWFWWVRGYLSEGREHLGQALEQGAGLRTVTVAKALNGAGLLARNQSDHAAAQSLYEESLGICRDLGNKHGIASALHGLGGTSHNQGDFTIARSQYEESLTIHRELGDKQGIASALNLLGLLACHQGDYVTARSLVEESLAVHRELGNKQGVASSLAALGHVALYQGDYTGARSLQEESLVTFRELGNKQGIGLTLGNLGTISHRQGDYVRARSRYEESLALFHSIGYKLGIAQSLTCLGHVARCQGYYDTARSRYEESLAIHRELGNNQNTASCLAGFASMALSKSEGHHAVVLWGVAHTLRESIGSPLPPNDQAEQDNQLEQALSLLGEEAFAIAFAEGRTMTWEQAVAFALDQTER